jgi:hypothetical protein
VGRLRADTAGDAAESKRCLVITVAAHDGRGGDTHQSVSHHVRLGISFTASGPHVTLWCTTSPERTVIQSARRRSPVRQKRRIAHHLELHTWEPDAARG